MSLVFIHLFICRRTKATVLLASTSEVYGDPEVHPQSETYWGHVNTIGPRSCYDEGKRVAESLMVAYNRMVCFSPYFFLKVVFRREFLFVLHEFSILLAHGCI